MRSEAIDAAAEVAAELVRRGYPPTEAVRIAGDAAAEIQKKCPSFG